MPRLAYTKDGEAVFVKTAVPLPVSDTVVSSTSTELMSSILLELKYIALLLEEGFQTGIEREDAER